MHVLKSKNINWIDIKNPGEKDFNYLKENFNFHPLILKELKNPTIRPKVEEADHSLFLVLHFPIYNPHDKKIESSEIDFLITKDSLITIHYSEIPPYDRIRQTCELNEIQKERCFGNSTPELLYNIVNALFDFSLKELDHIRRQIDRMEEEIFSNREREMVERLSLSKRDILDFAKTINPQKVVLSSLTEKGIKLFGKNSRPYFNDIRGEYIRLKNIIDNHQQVIDSLNKTNESLLTIKTNEIVKVLTVFAVIVFPLTLLSSIFGMNTNRLPIAGHPYDFWIILAIMGLGTLVMIGFFKWKKWI